MVELGVKPFIIIRGGRVVKVRDAEDLYNSNGRDEEKIRIRAYELSKCGGSMKSSPESDWAAAETQIAVEYFIKGLDK